MRGGGGGRERKEYKVRRRMERKADNFMVVSNFPPQLDLQLEAENLCKFQELLGGYSSVKFPTPIHPFVTRSVLVESFEV